MRVIFAALLVLTSVSVGLPPAWAMDFHPFVRGSWQQLKAAHRGRPTIVHFWSITCAPCIAEMPLWRQMVLGAGGVDMVLVSTDPIADIKVTSAPIDKAGLAKADNWVFADRFTDRLYFEVSPHWQGELPYTVLIGRDGKTVSDLGDTDPAKLKAWIASQKA